MYSTAHGLTPLLLTTSEIVQWVPQSCTSFVYTHTHKCVFSEIPHTLDRTSRPQAQLVVWGTWRGTPWGRAHSRAPGPRGGTASSRSHSCRPAVQHQQGLWWVLAASHSKRDHVLVLTGMQAKETQSWGRSKSGFKKSRRHAQHHYEDILESLPKTQTTVSTEIPQSLRFKFELTSYFFKFFVTEITPKANCQHVTLSVLWYESVF